MSVCDVPVIAEVCDVAGEAAATLVSAPFDWLASAIGHAAAWMFEGVWAIFDTTTLVDVTSSEYVAVYNILFGVAVFVMLTFFCLQLMTGLLRRDPAALQRAGLGLAKSVLGSFLVITLTATLLEIVDQLCVGIVHATGTSLEEMGERIGALAAGLTAITFAAPGVGAIITIFLAGLAVSAAAIVWFSLLIRKALLLVAIVLAPIALSGASWDATRGWFGKWASFVLALILSKLVMVVVFLVAIAQVSAPIDFDLASIADPIAGIVLMFVAAFAPYMTYKFISFVGFDTYHAISTEQEAKNALNRPAPVPATPRTDGVKAVLDDDTGGQSNTGGRAAPPPSGPRPGVPADGFGVAGQQTTPAAGSARAAGGSGRVGVGRATAGAADSDSGTDADGTTCGDGADAGTGEPSATGGTAAAWSSGPEVSAQSGSTAGGDLDGHDAEPPPRPNAPALTAGSNPAAPPTPDRPSGSPSSAPNRSTEPGERDSRRPAPPPPLPSQPNAGAPPTRDEPPTRME